VAINLRYRHPEIDMSRHELAKLFAVFIFAPLFSCTAPAVDTLQGPTAEQLARKYRSEAQLHAEGVPVNEQLAVIQSAGETALRSKADVENRVLCLIVVAGKADGMDERIIQAIVRRYELEASFSPWEKQFIYDKEQTWGDFRAANWRYESAWALLWSLGYTDTLSWPDQEANVPEMVRLITGRSAEAFRRDAKLRSVASILDSTDLVYRYHWAVSESRTAGQAAPAGLIPSVIHERHQALNWLIAFQSKDWDDVSTATIAD
jgi:hypothetical protein